MCFSGSDPPGGMDGGAGPVDAGAPIAGCPAMPGHILVTLRYQFGAEQPVIPNSQVELRGPSWGLQQTDAHGQARFNDLPPEAGYEVIVEGSCITRGTQSTSVTQGVTTPVDILVQALGTLQGRVTDAAHPGTGIASATVTLSGHASHTATTDASGHYSIPSLSSGTYQLSATKPGFTTQNASHTVNFRPCGSETVDLQIRQIVLEIVDGAGHVISGTTVRKMVGNKMRLGLQTRPAGEAISVPRWTIPGTRVKSYVQSVASGVKTALVAADLQVMSPEFHWIDGGSQAVSISAQVAGATLTATVTFTVLKPTVDHFTAATSSVNLCAGTYFQPGTWLAAYRPGSGTVGCQWDAKVTVPAEGVGQVGITQLIRPTRIYTSNANAISTRASAAFVLDEGLGIQYSGPLAVAASSSKTLNGTNYADSPANGLVATDRASSAADVFQSFLMYKSDEADSIWVSLSSLTWQWAGSTTRIGAPASPANNWNAPAGASLSATASGLTANLPVWSTNFGAIPWV